MTSLIKLVMLGCPSNILVRKKPLKSLPAPVAFRIAQLTFMPQSKLQVACKSLCSLADGSSASRHLQIYPTVLRTVTSNEMRLPMQEYS